jgi:hypothetical protein
LRPRASHEQVADAAVDRLEQSDVRLADDQQDDRGDDQRAKGEAINQRLERQRQP